MNIRTVEVPILVLSRYINLLALYFFLKAITNYTDMNDEGENTDSIKGITMKFKYLLLISIGWLGACEQVVYEPNNVAQNNNPNSAGSINPNNGLPPGQVPAVVDETGPASGTFSLSYNKAQPAVVGVYQPSHLQSIWITNAQDVHVVTLSANPGARPQHLRQWQVHNGAQLDGFTGATITTYDANNQVAWDLTDQLGAQINYGSYKLWFEVTESNTVDGIQNGEPGYVIHQVPFTLNSLGLSMTDNNHPSFPGIQINFVAN